MRSSCLLLVAIACAPGDPLPPRASEQSCRPWIDGAPVATLGESGCFREVRSMEPSPDLVAYGVASPLWTDDAEKRRWIVVPPESSISLSASGELDLPSGTILIKLFQFRHVADHSGIKRMEVRFLVYVDGEWEAFSYEFDESGTEAYLVTEDRRRDLRVRSQEFSYLIPGPASCRACHAASRRVLGFDTEQLNSRYDYGPASENQLIALAAIGLITSDVDIEPRLDTWPRLVDPLRDRADIATRARSYLHANCSHCHRPGGFGETVGMDLRAHVPLEDTRTCNVPIVFLPTRFYRIAPGSAEASGILLRMTHEDPIYRMPPIGTSLIDEDGAALLRRWIDGLEGCSPSP